MATITNGDVGAALDLVEQHGQLLRGVGEIGVGEGDHVA